MLPRRQSAGSASRRHHLRPCQARWCTAARRRIRQKASGSAQALGHGGRLDAVGEVQLSQAAGTWTLAVFGLMKSASPICRLVSPSGSAPLAAETGSAAAGTSSIRARVASNSISRCRA